MSRIVVASLLLAGLALAPSAAAKGPHAIVESGPGGIEPGEAWATTLTLVEFGGREVAAARPVVILRSRSERFAVRPKRLEAHVPRQPDVLAEARYRLRVVFPHAGRWSYTVLDGTRERRRFHFPAAKIGRNAERVTTGFVAFPEGSPEEAQGAGGAILGDAVPAGGGRGDSLPPEVVSPATSGSDGGGLPLWIPAAGLALAGAGTLTLMRRRHH
jgi:MYXO-CTERM domain-containing protein